MNGFWHYLATTPMRHYPWWGHLILAVILAALWTASFFFFALLEKLRKRT